MASVLPDAACPFSTRQPWRGDLTTAELARLRSHALLFERWGYRAGKDGDHTRYEDRTHREGLRWLQFITDPLFRNLQQVCAWGQAIVFYSDVAPMVDRAEEALGGRVSLAQIEHAVALLREFAADDTVRSSLIELAGYADLTAASSGFAAVVMAARAVALLANERSADALAVIRCMKTAWPRDSSW